MLREVHAIAGMRIHAVDGDIGHVHDVYFDHTAWRVRYFHVDTRAFLAQHVLLAPTIVRSVDWDRRRIDVAVTREQVHASPTSTRTSPYRQHDMPLNEYGLWPLASSPSSSATAGTSTPAAFSCRWTRSTRSAGTPGKSACDARRLRAI